MPQQAQLTPFPKIIAFTSLQENSYIHQTHASFTGRRFVQIEISARVAYALRPFISNSVRGTFFNLMDITRSVVYGIVPWTVISTPPQIRRRSRTYNVEIAVPHGRMDDWRKFLGIIGYKEHKSISVPGFLGQVIDIQYTFVQETRSEYSITVSQSMTSSVLPIILSSHTTCQMNILSSSHLFCFYPNLTMEYKALASFQNLSRAQIPYIYRRLVSFTSTTEFFGYPCGEVCPAIWRHTRGLQGVGVIRWNEGKGFTSNNQHRMLAEFIKNIDRVDYEPYDALTEYQNSTFKWRTGSHCLNPKCEYSTSLPTIRPWFI
ncbi:hypothetical protein Hypma_015887 [Hypsizygus marmoreus]|uniref:Uncharacterized protein n=1 Tax=Hypsizygus marmoreus TaxID=39966 RepID=A0A369K4X0_HYPMA|nr:hypothetical protein Hypma_015887 [Hypsizygus marmoreus]